MAGERVLTADAVASSLWRTMAVERGFMAKRQPPTIRRSLTVSLLFNVCLFLWFGFGFVVVFYGFMSDIFEFIG